MRMDVGQMDVAKMYFEQGIKYYPESANVYDSMSDYYEIQEDYANAIKYAEKALSINENDYYKEKIAKLKLKL